MAPAISTTALAGLLATMGSAVLLERNHLRGTSGASTPVLSYRNDCFKKHLALAEVPKPGAGMVPSAIKPFQEVLKDGFYQVDCVKDYLFEHGDAFGDNRASYKLGDVSNISIVHYAAHVPKEDRHEMTHDTCFRFCRSVPDMLFFGITNGRECYCAPYYKAEADDSSLCDAPCDGDTTMMCGGKSKSSIFAMHSCGDTFGELTDAKVAMIKVHDDLAALLVTCKSIGEAMQATAVSMQNFAGSVGDPGASDLMQTAKVRAGEFDAACRAGKDLETKLAALAKDANAFNGLQMKSPDVAKGEKLTEDMEALTGKAKTASKEIRELLKHDIRAQNVSTDAAAAATYFPLMYFVNQELQNVSSTCTGVAAEKPILATNAACAHLCNEDMNDCVGYSFFPAAKDGLCFLMSKFQTARYYTQCQGEFDQQVRCYAKLSKFEGTSLAPKGDGTCEACLKEAKEAERCFM